MPRRTSCRRPATGDIEAKRAAENERGPEEPVRRPGVAGGDAGVETGVGGAGWPGSW